MDDRQKFQVWDAKYKWMYPGNGKVMDSDLNLFLDADGELFEGPHDNYGSMTLADKNRFKIRFCTGLRDRAGKLIYEGDVLRNPEDSFKRNYMISWNDGGFWFEPVFKDIRQWGKRPSQEDMKSCEIIGNIYEHPELLK